ncbi:uncharacterized protein SCHCODRAFT_02646111 [Schizophyllum commune H4-8]|uniref:uncharacterized protein n=1 Tax=Schizophyllum commune (strain H4-8 / FGSC 9210) TaxID=578458 RepID=UPI00215F0DFA|nr:uncharacterized protein SCHCODRAFT_02646111 [Schizophyllum commune H4-8]KAI5836586.1 hypothetical protein SCHCODRAFT_02646111 [Schizophyllum commune H4-8]
MTRPHRYPPLLAPAFPGMRKTRDRQLASVHLLASCPILACESSSLASGLPLYTTAVFCTLFLLHKAFHIRQRPLACRPPSSTSPASRTRLRHC